MLEIACRVPDHGMMEPWRFLVLPKATRGNVVTQLVEKFRAAHPDATDGEVDKIRLRFQESPLIVAVISRTAVNPKVPEIEQILSAGAVCMNLLHAAQASGFGAIWLTGWAAFAPSCREIFSLQPNEQIAGFIHLGTAAAGSFQRRRPDLGKIVSSL
jgi:nitroreductase